MVKRPQPAWLGWALEFVLAGGLATALVWGSVGEAYGKVTGSPTTVVGPPQAYPHPGVFGYSLVALAALVVAGRRRWPISTFAVSLGAVLVYAGLGYVDGAAAVAPVVALYTVAVTAGWRRSVALGVLTLAGLWVLDIAFGPFGVFGGGNTVFPFAIAASLFAGLAVRNRRAYVAGIEERAALAERSVAEEARRRVDAERLRIARELHDVVAHSIAMINVQSGVAAHVLDTQPEVARQALVSIKGASKVVLRELRSILDVLRQADDATSTTPAPGMGQLDVLVSAATSAGLAVAVNVSGDAQDLPPTVDLAAYRIVQESLTNALRHSGPARTAVSICYRGTELVVEVADDGRGCGSGLALAEGTGHGIAGMRERAQAVGGTLEAGPGPGGGWTVRAYLPLAVERAAVP